MAKVSLKLITEIIHKEYVNISIPTYVHNKKNTLVYVQPLVEPTPEQLKILLDGDGQKKKAKKDEYKQINSSTGLVVNYYKILEELGGITDLVFEHKVARPLNKGGSYANLDVSYRRDGVLYFVESKFLEPYYSWNETIEVAYLDVSKYPKEVKDNKEEEEEEWNKLFLLSKEFKYYNFTQLCRHLLALYRYTHGLKSSPYNGEKVILQSITWEMTQQFLERLEQQNCKEMLERIKQLKNEEKKCQEIFDLFITKIKWDKMSFQTRHYNDMLDDIKLSKHDMEFRKRYFFN